MSMPENMICWFLWPMHHVPDKSSDHRAMAHVATLLHIAGFRGSVVVQLS